MGLENRKFKCKSDFTLYTLGPLEEDGYHNITWTHEDGSKDVDKWRGVTVDKKFDSGDWYFIEEELSIARPILEERKIGKVQMDLFDSGFPNAVMEVAKVMTWASLNKGYKPHDWKNLPNPETAFPAAASRHRLQGLTQQADGVPALERTDDESKLVHLAHQCFNCLAELELVLTGKIK